MKEYTPIRSDAPQGRSPESKQEGQDVRPNCEEMERSEGDEKKTDACQKDQPVELPCINERYEGQCHPETGVPYERKRIEHDGILYEGVFPEFDSAFDATLPEDKFQATDREHIKEANTQLKDAVEKNPDIKEKFTAEQLEQIENGDTPDGYTWHHNEDPGRIQLVDTKTHNETRHTGGRVIWGGGSEHRT